VAEDRETDVDGFTNDFEALVERGQTLGKPDGEVPHVVVRHVVHILVVDDGRSVSRVGVDRDIVRVIASDEIAGHCRRVIVIKDLVGEEGPVSLEDEYECGDGSLEIIIGELGQHSPQFLEIYGYLASGHASRIAEEAEVRGPDLNPFLGWLRRRELLCGDRRRVHRDGNRDGGKTSLQQHFRVIYPPKPEAPADGSFHGLLIRRVRVPGYRVNQLSPVLGSLSERKTATERSMAAFLDKLVESPCARWVVQVGLYWWVIW